MAVRAPWRPTARRSPGDLEHEEDRRLAALAADGDEAAFEAIFERHHRGLLTFSRHLLGSQEEAEDALQHTFTAAYRRLVEDGPPDHLRAWLYASARNRCYSMLRARRELPQDSLPEAAVWVPEEVEHRSDLRDLLSDLERLPDDQRSALVLAEIEDLGHAEVAEVLGCPPNKVRALVFQARTTLGGWREARSISCRDVREELAVARGPELRRAGLTRHLAVCPDCTAFREDVDEQRRRVALLLPPVPIAIALKEGMLEAAVGGVAGGAATAGAAGGAAAGGGVASAVKIGAAALVIGGAGVAGFGGLRGGGEKDTSREPKPAPAVEEPQASGAPAQPSGGQGAAKKKKGQAKKRLTARERAGQAGPTESVEESTAPAQVSPAGGVPQAPSVSAPPVTSQPAPSPKPAPPPEAGLEADVPPTPVTPSEGEIRSAPPADPTEPVP
jgi:RNA polymerase sigma factor (sigma-70 family)